MADGDDRLRVGLRVLDELRSAPDRHAAIVGACFVEYGVDQLLSHQMKVDGKTQDEIDKQLDDLSFYDKVKRTASISAVNDAVRADLHVIRKIRNAFAHELLSEPSAGDSGLLDFESSKIVELCADLIQPVDMALTADPKRFPAPTNNRDRFTQTVKWRFMDLHNAITKLTTSPP